MTEPILLAVISYRFPQRGDSKVAAKAAELGVGVDVALFVRARVEMNAVAFVEFTGSRWAGHATQRQCSADN